MKGFIKKFKDGTRSVKKQSTKRLKPSIISRSEHTVSRKAINQNALKVLYRLNQAGYAAYLVGGCVRDLLLNHPPKDFDIATSAKPEEVRRLFKNCILIGRRFRLAHILFGKEIIEVATFRSSHENASEQHGRTHEGMIVRDNVYGSIEEDALRRDFTVNALYYNIADFSIADYANGIQDLHDRKLRMIGDPEKRYLEDPVRLLRAIRIAGKLNFTLSAETEAPLIRLSYLLQQVSSSRLFQEVLKFFSEGATANTFKLLQKYHLFEQLFPQTAKLLQQKETSQLLHLALTSTDQRVQEKKTVSPVFLFSVFIWPSVLHEMKKMQTTFSFLHLDAAIQLAIKKQKQRLDIPKRLLMPIREIFLLQYRFAQRRGKQPFRLLDHPRFRAAYDLLLLRAESGEEIKELAQWWGEFHDSDAAKREQMVKVASAGPKKRAKKKEQLPT